MKVLIVEDSPSVSEIIKAILESDDEIEVVATVKSGIDAVNFVQNNKVDVVTMDYYLEGEMDGLEATKEIMHTSPVPIVIMSSSFKSKNAKDIFRALEAGALSIFDKPHSFDSEDFENYAEKFIKFIKMLSGVQVIKRKNSSLFTPTEQVKIEIVPNSDDYELKKIRLIAFGASTGGPQTLKTILSGISENYPLPIVIVQHITEGFIESMVNWLNEKCSIKLKIGEDNEEIKPGVVYFAPDDRHMTVTEQFKIRLNDSPPIHSCKPSVSKLFESINLNITPDVVGILLTGMGKDGAEELKRMKDKGAITIAQDEESSIVYGMPKEAVKLRGATYVFNPNKIVEYLNKIGDEFYASKNIYS